MKNWSFIALIFVLVALVWGGYFFVKAYANSGDIRMTGTVYSEGKSLPGASVYLGDDIATSDPDGIFTFYHLTFGYKKIVVSKDGFVPYEQGFLLWKKDYQLPKIDLVRDENHNASFSGTVLNSFDRTPIKGAIITLGESNTVTDEKGQFNFKNMTKGDFPLKISAIGFADVTDRVSLGKPDGSEKEYLISPYGKISFTSAREGKKNIYTIDYSGAGLTNLTMGIKGDCWGSRFTPDGKRIIFMSNMGSATDQWGQKIPGLYVMNINGGGVKKISSGIVPVGEYRVTSDSKRVVFNGHASGSDKYEIFIAGIDNPEDWIQLEDNDITETDIDVSADGTMVLYGAFVEGARSIFAVNIDSRERKKIADLPNRESFLAFTPDSKSVVYVNEEEASGARVFQYDLVKDTSVLITDSLSSMDGIATNSLGDKLVYTSVRDDKEGIYVLDLQDKSEVALTTESGLYKNIVWPDLQKILVFTISNDDGNKLAVMDISKRKIAELEDVSDDMIGWSSGIFDNSSSGGL